jgi:translation initiation factor 2A
MMMTWCCNGRCDVDKTNQSYFGETNLYFLKADGSHDGNVPLGKEGPVHDVQWSPNGEAFVAVSGTFGEHLGNI